MIRFSEDKGSKPFWLIHEHHDWVNNNNTYTFNPQMDIGIQLLCIKIPEKKLIIFLDAPSKRTFFAKVDISDVTGDKIMLLLNWEGAQMNLYVNGNLKVTEKIMEENFTRIEFTLDSFINPIPLSKFIIILNELNNLFTSTESVIRIPYSESVLIGLMNGYGIDKVLVESLSTGSLKGIIKVPLASYEFVSDTLYNILSILYGHSKKIVEVYNQKQKAESSSAPEVVKEERIKTATEIDALYEKLLQNLIHLRPDIDEQTSLQLFNKGIKGSIERLTDSLLADGYILSLEEKK